MLKKVMLYVLVSILFLTPVLAECTMPYVILPPDIYDGDTIFLDGWEFKVTETRSGSTVTREMKRTKYENPENGSDISLEEAGWIVEEFFGDPDNQDILGKLESLTIEAVDDPSAPPIPVKFTSEASQYCDYRGESIEVLGTVSGVVNVGCEGDECDERKISSLIIKWYTKIDLDSLDQKINKEDVIKKNPDSQPELAILPTGDTDGDGDEDFKLVWKVDDDKLIDAETGNEVSQETGEEVPPEKILLLRIAIIILITLVGVFMGYLTFVKPKFMRKIPEFTTKIFPKKKRALKASEEKLLKKKRLKKQRDLKKFADRIRKKMR